MKTLRIAFQNNKSVRSTALILGIIMMSLLLLGVLPTAVNAAEIGTSSAYCVNVSPTLFGKAEFSEVVKFVVCFLQQSIVPFLFAIAVCVFFWGMVKFMSTGDSSEREQGKQFMLWGVIALAVMFSVWGLVDLFGQTFQVKSVIPQLPVN